MTSSFTEPAWRALCAAWLEHCSAGPADAARASVSAWLATSPAPLDPDRVPPALADAALLSALVEVMGHHAAALSSSVEDEAAPERDLRLSLLVRVVDLHEALRRKVPLAARPPTAVVDVDPLELDAHRRLVRHARRRRSQSPTENAAEIDEVLSFLRRTKLLTSMHEHAARLLLQKAELLVELDAPGAAVGALREVTRLTHDVEIHAAALRLAVEIERGLKNG